MKAKISATETLNIKEIVKNEQGQDVVTTVRYHVPVPDRVSGNDMAMRTITVQSMPNVDPMFGVMRSVPENSAPGTLVGDPIKVKEPDTGDTLTFTLSGIGVGNFTATSVASGIQIAVAEGAHLNYEHKQSYDLVLTLSDGKDAHGNTDSATDDSIWVQISLEDVVEPVTATVKATRDGGNIKWTFTVANPPTGATGVFYRYALRNTTTGDLAASGSQSRNSLSESFTHIDNYPYASGTYRVEGSVQYDADGTTHRLHADIAGDQTITIP